jgi:hypothetical protein
MFRTWLESSYNTLFQSAVDAFPNTTMRQHATGPIKINNIRFLPFIGLKTLLLRSEATNEDRHYKPTLLFKKVQYGEGPFTFKASDNGEEYTMQKLSLNDHDVLLRCECGDYFWRFHFYNWRDRSLWGHNRKPYDGMGAPVNPTESPGACKHIMAFVNNLKNYGIFNDNNV